MIEKIKALFIKYRELITYVIFGGLTTLVDFGVYWIFTRPLPIGKIPAQIAGVAAAIIFAFIVNKRYIFLDKKSGFKAVALQFVSFASMRVLSGAFQTFCLWLFSEKLGLYDMAVKVAVAVVVVILNYIFSKLLIFKESPRK